MFADLDVLAVGPSVREVSREFDLYWNSPSAYAAAGFVGTPAPDPAAMLEAKFAANRANPDSAAYIEAVRATPLLRDILDGRLPFEWTAARLFYDDPAKTLDSADRKDVLLFPQLVRTIGRPAETFDLVLAVLRARRRRHRRSRGAGRERRQGAHSHQFAGRIRREVRSFRYARRREDLLRAGVQLFELKPTAAKESRDGRDHFSKSSTAGLHAKTFAVDRSRIFVGSFNFDQRSALLNTEMGLVIDSPMLAQRLAMTFDTVVPRIAYEVRLAQDGRGLYWIERTAAGEQRFGTEPDTSWSMRMGVEMLSILPIEWLL